MAMFESLILGKVMDAVSTVGLEKVVNYIFENALNKGFVKGKELTSDESDPSSHIEWDNEFHPFTIRCGKKFQSDFDKRFGQPVKEEVVWDWTYLGKVGHKEAKEQVARIRHAYVEEIGGNSCFRSGISTTCVRRFDECLPDDLHADTIYCSGVVSTRQYADIATIPVRRFIPTKMIRIKDGKAWIYEQPEERQAVFRHLYSYLKSQYDEFSSYEEIPGFCIDKPIAAGVQLDHVGMAAFM